MPEPQQPPLAYERPASSPVPRWQFRLMFLLLLVNLAVTLQTAYAPGVTASVKQWWADYQQRRRSEALWRQAWNHAEPAGTVVWEDDPAAAAKLLGTGNYDRTGRPSSVRSRNYSFLMGWPQGAAAQPPAVASQFQQSFPIYDDDGRIPQRDDDWTLLLLHGLKTPGGQERVVYVVLESRTDIDSIPVAFNASATGPLAGTARRRMRLIATPCQPSTNPRGPRPVPGDTRELDVSPAGAEAVEFPFRWVPPRDDKPGEVVLEPKLRFRFYAGQPDPSDPSHFTIDYDLNDARSRIHGRLQEDGTVELKPDKGTVTGQLWDPGTGLRP